MRNKVVDAAEAVAIIRSGDTVASSGFVGVGTPDEIIKALERRFVQTGEPRDLALVFAKVGLGTFVDLTNGGGKLNERTTEELVRLLEIDGEQWLFYKAFPINVAIIRGTTADRNGNIRKP